MDVVARRAALTFIAASICLCVAIAGSQSQAWVAAASTPDRIDSRRVDSAAAVAPFILQRDGQYSLDQYVEVLLDSTGNLTVNDVSSPAYNDKFSIPKNHTAFHGYIAGNLWLRVRITDMLAHARPLYLESAYPLVEHLEFYESDGRKNFIVTKTGLHKPYNERSYRANTYVMKLALHRGETRTIYIKASSVNNIYTPLRLYTEEALIQHLDRSRFGFGIFVGALCAMLLFNLFIFLVVKIRSYIYLCIYISGVIVRELVLNGALFPLAPDYAWPYFHYFTATFFFLMGFGLSQFTRHFLMLREKMPTHDRVLFYCAVFVALECASMPVIGVSVSYRLAPAVGSLILVYVLILSIWRVAKGDRIAMYFVVAWSLTAVSTILILLQRAGVLPVAVMTDQGVQVIGTIEILLLAFALGARVNELRKQKDIARAQAVTNLEKVNTLKDKFVEELERKVEERTREIEAANAALRLLTTKVQKDSAVIGSLFESSVAIHQMEDVDELLARSVDQLQTIFGDHRFGIVIYGEGRGNLLYRSLRKIGAQEQDIIVNKANWTDDESGERMMIELNRLAGEVEPAAAHVWECIDIASRNRKLRGRIMFYGTPLNSGQLEIIQVFAHQISTAVENRTLSFELRRLANIDSLTGVGNRAVSGQLLRQFISNASSVPTIPFSVVQVDLNGLKPINDRFGHDAGDRYLIESARLLLQCCREHDVVVRQGGDEFMILCHNTDDKGAEKLVERIRARAAETIFEYRSPDGKLTLRQPPSLAIGAASSTEVAPENVVRIADERMYRDKQAFYAAHGRTGNWRG